MILWSDGFELADITAIRAQYEDSGAPASIASFRTNNGLGIGTGYLEKRFSQGYATLVVGIAYYYNNPTWNDTDIIRLSDSAGTRQLTLATTSSNTFQLWRGASSSGTLLATSPAVTPAFDVYVELLATIHPTTGAYELKINEVSQFSASNVNTRNGAYNDIQRVQVRGATNYLIDDFYIADTAAPTPLGYFLGNTKIEALIPNAAGDVTGWTAFSDSNYRNVDERPHNSDVDYNYSSTVNASDLYHLSNLSNSGNIRGVHVKYVARKDDALVRAVRPLIRTGGVTYAGGNDSLTTSYDEYFEVWTQNPQTLSEWSVADINALQVGIQTTS